MGEREDSLRLEHGLGTGGTARTGTGWSKRKDSERTRTKTKGRLRGAGEGPAGGGGRERLESERVGGEKRQQAAVSGRHGQRWMDERMDG